MKRFTNAAWVLSLFVVIACGGGKDSTPPPAASTPDPVALQTLQALAQNAQQTCCQSAAPYMVTYGTMIYSPNPAQVANIPQPGMDACKTAIMNFELQFRTIDNGAYANRPAPQQWRQDQGKAIVNCVGNSMQASGLPINAGSMINYMPAAMSLGNNLASAVPSLSGFQSYIPNTANSTGTTVSVNLGNGTASLNNGLAMSGLNTAYPFNNGVQVMPYIPNIPSNF